MILIIHFTRWCQLILFFHYEVQWNNTNAVKKWPILFFILGMWILHVYVHSLPSGENNICTIHHQSFIDLQAANISNFLVTFHYFYSFDIVYGNAFRRQQPLENEEYIYVSIQFFFIVIGWFLIFLKRVLTRLAQRTKLFYLRWIILKVNCYRVFKNWWQQFRNVFQLHSCFEIWLVLATFFSKLLLILKMIKLPSFNLELQVMILI